MLAGVTSHEPVAVAAIPCRFAGEVPELDVAVLFYGTPLDEATTYKFKASVLHFYGENNVRLASSVQVTIAGMEERSGKFMRLCFDTLTETAPQLRIHGRKPSHF